MILTGKSSFGLILMALILSLKMSLFSWMPVARASSPFVERLAAAFFCVLFLVFQASLWKISSILQGSITVTFNLFEMTDDTTLVNRKT